MPVVWMQNQLAQNKTHKLILNYINQVCFASVYLVPWENQPWSVPVFGSMPDIVFTIGGKKFKLRPKQLLSLTFYFCRLCEGGELLHRILAKKNSRYSEKDAAAVVRQMLKVAAECHLPGLVHRDMKPECAIHKAILSKKAAIINYLLVNSANPFIQDKLALVEILQRQPTTFSGIAVPSSAMLGTYAK
ncbi:unnamed protein product [Miscanthus lutarioriparius]|uniref:Protein kinase domain-containing protein n=1 Tax=Miscanthus lutarioriparius TaxID=422564 RepID=A0A811PX87_9POAL|nr:unnamed protein product [Miscanthus lutarioriparius]